MSKISELVERLYSEDVENVRGITYSKGDELTEQNGIPVLRANNITFDYNALNFNDVKFISPPTSLKVKHSQFLQKDDILICAGSRSKGKRDD